MLSFEMVSSAALVRTDVSEERHASLRVTGICGLETTLAVTRNRRTLRRKFCHPDDDGAEFLRNVGPHKSHTA
jgi:hypothetical protein